MNKHVEKTITPILRCNTCKNDKYSTISKDILTNNIKVTCLKCRREWK